MALGKEMSSFAKNKKVSGFQDLFSLGFNMAMWLLMSHESNRKNKTND